MRNVFVFLSVVALCAADTGTITPAGKDAPDAAILAIDSMDVHIVIDNGQATVSLKEVFQNKTDAVLEGTYALSLPGDAAVSGFAVWDDVTRIPGVILERKRAGELYNEIRNQQIDPGLLETGDTEEKHASGFTVKIVPIPAYGYKRIEAEYRQTVPQTQLASDFIFPLKPAGSPVRISHLSLSVQLRSAQSIASFESVGKDYPLKINKPNAGLVEASFEGSDIDLASDLELKYAVANDKAPHATFYRTGEASEPGYFEASSILQSGAASNGPHTVLVLFDTSLSMQWEKLERTFQALEATLRSLGPRDSFNVLVFNSTVASFSSKPQSATPEAIAKALDFVRASKLRGGTNLQSALQAALAQSSDSSYIVLLSDGDMTEGTIAPAKLAAWFDGASNALAVNRRPHLYALAIGDDANLRFLRRLTGHAGVFEQVNSTESLDFKLKGFLSKLGRAPLTSVSLSVSPEPQTSLVYRIGSDNFPGSRASWVGTYAEPADARIAIGNESLRTKFPSTATDHPYLPVTWARARVDALLEKIDREGEDKASIDEIIRLSRKYHFVTLYTSFLAAPRALLRPRLIRPGDPVLRVRTDSSIASVIAMFPFGLNKPLRHLQKEDIWQTRFLAPDDLADGVHVVRLILRDRDGHVYREQKTFVISSHPPAIRVQLGATRVRGGDKLSLRVQASETTRTITAQLYGVEPLSLHWTEREKANTGTLAIPTGLPAGRYSVHVTAEDIAHNVSHQEVPIEILP